ncbi:MAG: M24 family metallopeptidase [Halobacteriota archaeon]
MDSTPFERRRREAAARLEAIGAAAIVLFPGRNLQYLTGFYESPSERHFMWFLPADGEPLALVPELSAAQFLETSSAAAVRTWSDDEGPTGALSSIVSELALDGERLLVDDTMWARFTTDLRAAAPDATIGLASEVLGALRIRKDDAEIDALRRAGAVADEVVGSIRDLGEGAIGMTERELARRIDHALADAGGEGVSFETIVGSGPNGAMAHYTHGDRPIEAGDPVVLDFGTRLEGYPSDQTRTVVFAGDPDDRFIEIHETVRRAQTAAIEAIEPGVAAEAIDAAAREVIEAAGYGDRFIHRTGHGVGLDVHEAPDIVAGNELRVEPGMVFSVEPGIYLPGEFGVRIEDLVVVTDDACERLNGSDRGWRC